MARSSWIAAVLLVGCAPNPPVEHDGTCRGDGGCPTGDRCYQGTCISQADHDRILNKQSGIIAAPAEAPVLGGARVQVRQTTGEGVIFAACGATERMLGGGCSGGDDCVGEGCSYLRSYPGQFGTTDTLGARWYCAGVRGQLQAYALCQDAEPPGGP